MTFDQFAGPFLLLQTRFERPREDKEEERAFRLSWYEDVKDWRADLWGEVCAEWRRTGRWMPKVVELRDLYAPLVARRREEEAEAAYQETLRALPPPDPDGRAARLLRNVAHLRRFARALRPEE